MQRPMSWLRFGAGPNKRVSDGIQTRDRRDHKPDRWGVAQTNTLHSNWVLVPYFGSRPITAVETDDIEAFTAFLLNKGRGKKGLAPKTVRNILGFLHQVFEHGIARKLIRDNPVRHAEKPGRKKSGANPDLQFLTVSELEAVIRQIPDEVVIRKPKPTRKGHRGPSLHHLPMFLAPS